MALIEQLDAKIYQALKARLDTMSGGIAVVEPDETYPTESDTPFIVVQDVRFEPDPRCIGDNTRDEHRGTFELAVMAPLEWTHSQLLGVAGIVRSHFPKSLKLYYDDVKVDIHRTPFAGLTYRDGPFNRLPVSIRWRCSG
jgi:hypothetical protein